jgi:hypothetical protein
VRLRARTTILARVAAALVDIRACSTVIGGVVPIIAGACVVSRANVLARGVNVAWLLSKIARIQLNVAIVAMPSGLALAAVVCRLVDTLYIVMTGLRCALVDVFFAVVASPASCTLTLVTVSLYTSCATRAAIVKTRL